MKKQLIFTGVLLLASAVTGEAMATCTANRVTGVQTLLSGNTICVAKAGGGWESQEQHYTPVSGVGQLWDYKLGPTSPTNQVDPSKQLGTWKQTTGTGLGNVLVSYTYNAFTPSSPTTLVFQIYRISGTLGAAGSIYEFCTASGATPSATGTLKLGVTGGCP